MIKNSENSRRKFLRTTSILFSLSPLASTLAQSFRISSREVEDLLFDDEYHYFRNNLTNLHFYFLNAKITGNRLQKTSAGLSSYMVVKLPQQHVTEELIPQEKVDSESLKKVRSSRISGFSFLAFEIRGLDRSAKGGKGGSVPFISLENVDVLLDWNNTNLFALLVPETSDYTQFTEGTSLQISTDERSKEPLEFLKLACNQLFRKSGTAEGKFPLTILDLPDRLLLTPYFGEDSDTTQVRFQRDSIGSERFVYDLDGRRIHKSVEEIWNAEMWFQHVDENGNEAGPRFNPTLRPAGYVAASDESLAARLGECDNADSRKKIFLPSFLDRKELTYLAALGKGDNATANWNINTKGLTFTGLGAIAKFHYKNFEPPYGTDLVEYEHHITMGRDEYIKVARIGVISLGQRAIHVRVGERKIKDGNSYMEFYQYIEIIQKELTYFDSRLFIKGDTSPEPANYIHARTDPESSVPQTIHSEDEDDTETDNVWRDEYIWGLTEQKSKLPHLPGHDRKTNLNENWHTHYRRWPFKKIVAEVATTLPIDNTLPEAEREVLKDCAEAFWPVVAKATDGRHVDATLTFVGTDWNDQQIRFESTFLFIRKMFIEAKESELAKALPSLYNKFARQSFDRRHIRFLNSTLAFTPDFLPTSEAKEDVATEELPNKSNRPGTDFLEYYFSICKEPTGKVTTPQQTLEIIPAKSIFNERFFPVYPQLKRAQVYVESLQAYSESPLPSIVEYNEDFIRHGYYGKLKNKHGVDAVYNKGRLIFNHTEKFIKGLEEETIAETSNNISKGYEMIKGVFSGAGDAIGGLVNPDFDIQSIGLVKQSIALGKDFNKKYENAMGVVDKVNEFNPSDLLRQAPEIFNGISLIDILLEVFPEMEAPINEIKNVAAQIEKLRDEILNHPVFQDIKSELDRIKALIAQFNDAILSLEGKVREIQNQLKNLKDQLNIDHRFAELENIARTRIEQFKSAFLEYKDELVQFGKDAEAAVVSSITTELMSRVEALYPHHTLLRKARNDLSNLKQLTLPDGTGFSQAAKDAIQRFVDKHLSDTAFILINLSETERDKILRSLSDITGELTNEVRTYMKVYNEWLVAVKNEKDALKKYTLHGDHSRYKRFHDDLKSKELAIRNANATFILPSLVEEIEKVGESDKNLVQMEAAAFSKVLQVVGRAHSLVETVRLPYLIQTFEKASKEFEIIKYRLQATEQLYNIVQRNLEVRGHLYNYVQIAKQKVASHYASHYETFRKDVNSLVRESKAHLEAYRYVTDQFVFEGLPNASHLNGIRAILGLTGTEEVVKDILSIEDIKVPSIKALREELNKLKGELKEVEKKLIEQIRAYENEVKKSLAAQGNGLVARIKDEIRNLEDKAMRDPGNRGLINDVRRARELYNILTTLSRKEVNFKWSTSSFKNADFGIVSFVASASPRTTMSVNVNNTTHFESGKFPPVVSKVESIAENRLQNFGISLMKSMTVNFNEVSFIAGTNRKPKFDVKIRDVEFAGAFSFVQAFEDYLKSMMGDAFRLKLQPTNVNVGYTIPIPDIKTPSFNFFNLTLNFDFLLHFDKKPMELGFSLARPDNKFGITAGIYAGFGYFSLVAEPKRGLTAIEVGLEFGGYFGLRLGPLGGDVKLVAGLFYRKDRTGVVMEGYFLCEGRAKLWWAIVGVRFYMGVRSQNGNAEGRCTATYSLRVSRFYKKSFSRSYRKQFKGANARNQQAPKERALANFCALIGDDLFERQKRAIASLESFELDAAGTKRAETILLKEYLATETRTTAPLTFEEWNQFLDSYHPTNI